MSLPRTSVADPVKIVVQSNTASPARRFLLTSLSRLPLLLAAAALGVGLARAELTAPNFVYDNERSLTTSGDFDGDGRLDVALVEKDSGRIRLGYQREVGVWSWPNWRFAGTKFVSGLTVGKLLAPNIDALAFASADANLVSVLDVSNPKAAANATLVPITELGPNSVVAAEVGGEGKTSAPDLIVASIFNNDPTPNLGTLFRNRAGQFTKISDGPLPGPATRGHRVSLKAGQPDMVAMLITGEGTDGMHVADFSAGKPRLALTITNLPSGNDYVVARFGTAALSQFIFYKPGESNLFVRSLTEAGDKFEAGAGVSFALAQPIKQVLVVPQAKDCKLLVVFEGGATAGVFNFDGKSAPALAQPLNSPTNEIIFATAVVENGFIFFTAPPVGRAATRYQAYGFDGQQYKVGVYGGLPSLADTDDMTVPEIHQRIVANSKVTAAAQMQPYTNTIPGTEVNYEMVAISGGEFQMGTPASEASRNADEGPQHQVKLSPYWMGRYEVTWNEYQLFMYPDDEKRLRAIHPGDATAEKVSDAVSRPSRPYVEMSFGMGKDKFPAIAMTQHAANKYCHWLSAKTGHFYRLPTEAEWEFACRAGTKTAYYFGDDADKVGDYGWFFDNSDSKYQKVGKKKPNAWGLYDMTGNVVEWCLDQYSPDYYKVCADMGVVTDPWNRATNPYPHAVRGGSWDDDAPALRSGARRGSERTWKMTDPQLPKSIWYLSDSRWVGFRLVRPLTVPPPEMLVKYWTSGVERD